MMRFPRKIARLAFVIALMMPFIILGMTGIAMAEPQPSQYFTHPDPCNHYRRDLVKISDSVFGLKAPYAVLIAQLKQESGCNPEARSKFASGLAQFTPDTADWISKVFPKELAANTPLSPRWALHAQSRYVKYLYDETDAATPCDQMWMTLWKYNGGAGWVRRDQRLAEKSGANIHIAKEVEPFNAGRNPEMFKENRDYSRVILLKWQPIYSSWGGEIKCM